MRTNLGLILAAVMTAGSNIAKDIRSLAPSIESVAGESRYQPSRTVQIGGDSWHPTTRGPEEITTIMTESGEKEIPFDMAAE